MKETFPKTDSGAMRQSLGIRYDHFPFQEIVDAYTEIAIFGAKKYEVDNWRKGLPMSQIAASAQRHLWAWQEGEEYDPESGLPHLHHFLWNAVALVYNRAHDLGDDRFASRRKDTSAVPSDTQDTESSPPSNLNKGRQASPFPYIFKVGDKGRVKEGGFYEVIGNFPGHKKPLAVRIQHTGADGQVPEIYMFFSNGEYKHGEPWLSLLPPTDEGKE